MFDLKGRLVKDLINQKQRVGDHHIVWNGKGNSGGTIASGAYLIRIIADQYSTVKKMIMFK